MGKPTDFVVRQGSQLLLNGETFRFAGPNIYWLGLDENVDGVNWPTPFRVSDALDTARIMGATVIRSHTLGVSHGCSEAIMPALGQYNEEALRRVDYAIKETGERGMRLIIPLVCNWQYYHGGRSTFTGWRGLENADDFYTHAEVISDFKDYITFLLNRVNTYTGIAYKDDPVIMAWETGNELNAAPASWVQEICRHIKETDTHHLIAHGKQFGVDAGKLEIPELDIMDVHYYPADAVALQRDAGEVESAGKVFIAGEFGWPEGDLHSFLRTAEETPSVAGTMFWSLFGHHDASGYVQHYDGFSLHYPGTGISSSDAMLRRQMLREHAFVMSGGALTEEPAPASVPVITCVREGEITFRGVAGAAHYTLERSVEGPEGSWSIVYDRRASDYNGPWTDPGRVKSLQTCYRVKAVSMSGLEGEYSKVRVSEPF